MKAPIPLSRTRKQTRNIQNFYKQAGLEKQIQNMYNTNLHKQTMPKKDRLLQKRRQKLDIVSKADTKSTSEQQQSEVSSEEIKDDIISQHVSTLQSGCSSKLTLSLDKILNRLSIIQITDGITVQGCYGHSTIIFQRPVIQGQYYLEFKILKPNLNCFKAKINSQPSARFGICPPTYPKNSPLGQDISLGFKSSNGGIVTKGKEEHGSQQLQQNDVIGLGLSFSPPDRYQNKNEFWQDSKIVLTKNGKIIGNSSKVYQQFYCPAFSLYNYASLEIRLSKQSQEFKIEGYEAYQNIFNEEVNYENLKESALFSHPIPDDF